MSNSVNSKRIRSRGRGNTPEERKLSRAAFKAWDTRRKNERSKSAVKANRSRSR